VLSLPLRDVPLQVPIIAVFNHLIVVRLFFGRCLLIVANVVENGVETQQCLVVADGTERVA